MYEIDELYGTYRRIGENVRVDGCLVDGNQTSASWQNQQLVRLIPGKTTAKLVEEAAGGSNLKDARLNAESNCCSLGEGT